MMSKVPKKFTKDFMDELKTLIPDFHMEITEDESIGETKLYIAKGSDDDEDPVDGIYVHMSDVYKHYQNGVPIGVIARHLTESCITGANDVTNTAFKVIQDWESAKSLIIGRLYNPQLNPEYCSDKICRPIAGTDLVVTYYLQVETDTKLFRVCVSDGLMHDWGVTIDDLERARIDNAPTLNEPCVMNINGILAQYGYNVPSTDASANMITVTNEAKKYGAISVLDPWVHSELDIIFGAFGYYLIPSSVHEFLAVGGDSDPNNLRQMLKDINDNVLDPKDILSYNIYIWKDGGLKIV
jgi:hypothetical protein